MNRIEYFNDPNAPPANSLVPAASAVVTNECGEILMIQRTDNGLWAIPGGGMEIGESITETIVREVGEETGLDVVPERVIGVYSNPNHVVEFSDGEVRQQFSVCFACRVLGGHTGTSSESSTVRFVAPDQLKDLPVHPSIRLRIEHYLANRSGAVIG